MAIVATARQLAESIYWVLVKQEAYREIKAEKASSFFLIPLMIVKMSGGRRSRRVTMCRGRHEEMNVETKKVGVKYE